MRTILAGGALVLLLSSCGGYDGGITPPPPPPPGSFPSFSVGVSGAASITRGSNAEVTVTVFRLSGSTAIDLSVEGLPAGVTAVFAPATVPAASTTSTLTLSATSTATLGTVVAAIRARAAGASDATTQLVISVSP